MLSKLKVQLFILYAFSAFITSPLIILCLILWWFKAALWWLSSMFDRMGDTLHKLHYSVGGLIRCVLRYITQGTEDKIKKAKGVVEDTFDDL